jgi:formyltetrahydrofolate-dependent phosphoribosylglycinamide formyltransferase
VKLAVLCSGSGSNLQALLEYLAAAGANSAADVVLVASDQGDAGALERAHTHGIPAIALSAIERSHGLLPLLQKHAIEMVVLAGYLRLVRTDVTTTFRGRILNIHPALLPSFGGAGMYGHRVHDAVIRSGVRVSGATVHFVDDKYDHGPIIAQWPVPVFPADDADTLARRVLAVEHLIFPRAIAAVASGAVSLGEDGRVRYSSHAMRGWFALHDDPGAAAHVISSR